MSAATDAEDARTELAPDDVVGNQLCDSLLESPDPAVIRVLNHHGGWAESAPSWMDFRRTLEVCDIVGRWPAVDGHGSTILVRSLEEDGLFARVPIRSGAAVANVAVASSDLLETLVKSRGAPELVPLDDVESYFLDGDAR